MSTVERRITIEQYEEGGYSILEEGKPDVMGSESVHETIQILIGRLEE